MTQSVPVGEIVDVLNQLVGERLIRAFGGSNWTTTRLEEARRYAKDNAQLDLAFRVRTWVSRLPNEPTWAGCTHALRWT